jgi:hypothetical protein
MRTQRKVLLRFTGLKALADLSIVNFERSSSIGRAFSLTQFFDYRIIWLVLPWNNWGLLTEFKGIAFGLTPHGESRKVRVPKSEFLLPFGETPE